MNPTIVIALMAASAGASAESASCRVPPVTKFAVVCGEIAPNNADCRWIGPALAFDLEKRLGQLSSLEPVDRIDLRLALKSAEPDAKSRVSAAFAGAGAGVVLMLSGGCLDGKLSADLRVWNSTAGEPVVLSVKGGVDGLLSLEDELVEKVVECLKGRIGDLGRERHPQGVRLRTAQSVVALRHLAEGVSALQAGRIEDARVELAKVLELEPRNWWGHYFAGATELYRGRAKEAAECCKAAIAVDPDVYAGVYANLSYCCAGIGDLQKAQWAKSEFERRTGKRLPPGGVPGGMFAMPSSGNR